MRQAASGNGGDPLTVFVHIPRTAGTAFTYSLRAAYGEDRVGKLGNVFKGGGGLDPERLDRGAERRLRRTTGCVVVAGHAPLAVTRKHVPPDSRYVTVLREPVERTFSHYRNVLRARDRQYMVAGRTLEDLLAEGVYLQSDLQTRMLCDDSPFGEVTSAMLEQAKANLCGALGFGLTERLDESLELVGRRLGVVLTRPPQVHRRPTQPAAEPTPESLRAVQQFNEHDIELYRWACAQFEQQAAALATVAGGVA